jgi:hypothetical protein
MGCLRDYHHLMKILDHFEVVDLEGSFIVVDRSATPGRTVSVHANYDEAYAARDREAVVPVEWLRDELLEAIAVSLSERGIPYPSVIRALEDLGEDQLWVLVGHNLDLIEQAAGLSAE